MERCFQQFGRRSSLLTRLGVQLRIEKSLFHALYPRLSIFLVQDQIVAEGQESTHCVTYH